MYINVWQFFASKDICLAENFEYLFPCSTVCLPIFMCLVYCIVCEFRLQVYVWGYVWEKWVNSSGQSRYCCRLLHYSFVVHGCDLLSSHQNLILVLMVK